MAQKCKTGEVYDIKLKKCRRNVRRKNQGMTKSDKKAGEVLDVLIKNNPATMTYKTLKYAKDKDVLGQMMGKYPPSAKQKKQFDQRNKELKKKWGNPTLRKKSKKKKK
tara:strand:- start:1263 stop:1586 length:324 start_codon:yes stop_codon:yes gene_type:complete